VTLAPPSGGYVEALTLLRDRPLVRIRRPELLRLAFVHPDYAALLESVSHSVDTLEETLAAVDAGLTDPLARAETRRQVAADLFYRPGTATARSVTYLYEAMALEGARTPATTLEATCRS